VPGFVFIRRAEWDDRPSHVSLLVEITPRPDWTKEEGVRMIEWKASDGTS
jgi:hypothetical protein